MLVREYLKLLREGIQLLLGDCLRILFNKCQFGHINPQSLEKINKAIGNGLGCVVALHIILMKKIDLQRYQEKLFA